MTKAKLKKVHDLHTSIESTVVVISYLQDRIRGIKPAQDENTGLNASVEEQTEVIRDRIKLLRESIQLQTAELEQAIDALGKTPSKKA
tara:strand:- start:321 stop:584 length:264 start_codon:yes stop_codon:yes gene_type:complete